MRSRSPPDLLGPSHLRWLGALLVATQLPQANVVPVWAAVCGLLAVALRLLLVRRGQALSEGEAPRVPSWALVLFALGSAGALYGTFGYFFARDPCVAFLFILVGIKYLEARTTRDGTLLLCLAGFLLVTPFFYSQSLLAAAAAVPGVVLLGATLQVLAQPPDAPPRSRLSMPEALRRTLILLVEGIPIAVLLFVMFPRLSTPLWGVSADFRGTTGLSDRMAPGMLRDLSLSDAVAFRVDFTGTVPAPQERYWRGPVFARFNGRDWTPGALRFNGRFVSLRESSFYSYTVSLEPHYKPWLFALDLPAALPVPTDADDGGVASGPRGFAVLTRDQQLLAGQLITHPVRYFQVSAARASYPAAADDAARFERAESLQLPRGSPRTLEFAAELRRRMGDDDRAFIDAVLRWFHDEPFVYTLQPSLTPIDPVDSFLFETRRGFCEHYASAFVVLLRAGGIPARVVTGYQGGEINPNGGYMIVRQSDAHAWTEALVDGEWQRFDPTAAVAPSRIERGLGGALPSEERVPLLARLDEGWLKRVNLAWDSVNRDWRRHVIDFNFEAQRGLWRQWNLDRLAPWQMAVAGALSLAAWGGFVLAWLALRRRKREDRVLLLWDRLCRRLSRAGLPRATHEGPIAYAARAARRWPELAVAFTVIGDAYAELRYGRSATLTDSDRERAAALGRLARAIKVLPRPASLRAALPP